MKLVFTTVEKKKDAERIAHTLVKEKLAGCVLLLPVNSRFLWKNKFTKTKEKMLLIKVKNSNEKKAMALIKKIHPYDLPAIISVNAKANKEYEKWL